MILAAATAAGAVPATAGVPDPRFSTMGAVIVGDSSGQAVGSGYQVVVRDVNTAPVSGQTVTLNFSGTGTAWGSTQPSGITVNCVAKTLSKISNGSGAAVFTPILGRFNNTPSVQVSANGVVIGSAKTRSTDLDGAPNGTTGLGDFTIFADRYLNHPSAQETDFDLNGSTGLGDFTIFSREYILGFATVLC